MKKSISLERIKSNIFKIQACDSKFVWIFLYRIYFCIELYAER